MKKICQTIKNLFKKKKKEPPKNADQKEEVKKRLRSLGYLDE